ncbi:MAG TPA: hypothetical protein VHO70_08955, partial [Chitinispirillaceae bacterium]|nr:hypothetical protein [Chitinispirillaceae bacterium]
MRKKITLLIIKKQFFFSILLMWSAVLQAGPKITLKSLIVDAGTTVEGTSETLKFRFTFKNSGTSPL